AAHPTAGPGGAFAAAPPTHGGLYDSLNDEQKARFNALNPDAAGQQQGQRNLAQVCGQRASGIAGLPLDRIDRVVEPDETQRGALKELQNATAEAAKLLDPECPTYRATSPGGRYLGMEPRRAA